MAFDIFGSVTGIVTSIINIGTQRQAAQKSFRRTAALMTADFNNKSALLTQESELISKQGELQKQQQNFELAALQIQQAPYSSTKTSSGISFFDSSSSTSFNYIYLYIAGGILIFILFIRKK